jgi:4-alpha-glucanotransferase
MARSAFAGNDRLLSIEELVSEGLLGKDALAELEGSARAPSSSARAPERKRDLVRRSFEVFRHAARAELRREFEAFVEDPVQAGWLEDWVLYAALRDRFGGRRWPEWDRELATRNPGALARARAELAEQLSFERYVQFLFFRQWGAIRRHAARLGIGLLGDLPIYVAHESADVWTKPHLFRLDREGWPEALSGVPPDAFSATGQLWGTPVYRWEEHRKEGFSWWIERVRSNLRLADWVRLDHFRGFVAYWEVPAGEADATRGRWVQGPGLELFRALENALGRLPFIAEDLGHVTPDVLELRRTLGIPGMKVLLFGLTDRESPHHPSRVGREDVLYTSTHDTEPLRGWFDRLSGAERARMLAELGSDGTEIEWDLLRMAYESQASLVIAPLQDVFGLGNEARMNIPARAEGNWGWRAERELFSSERAQRLRALARTAGRTSPGRPEAASFGSKPRPAEPEGGPGAPSREDP